MKKRAAAKAAGHAEKWEAVLQRKWGDERGMALILMEPRMMEKRTIEDDFTVGGRGSSREKYDH